MANKLSFDFPMYEKLKKKLEALGGDVLDNAVDKAIADSHEYVTAQLEQAISPHRKTGKTASSLDKVPNVVKTGTEYSADVGFHITEGGLPSIFLMYGTKVHGQPHIQPDKALYNAIYGNATKKRIQEIQSSAFFETIGKVMKE